MISMQFGPDDLYQLNHRIMWMLITFQVHDIVVFDPWLQVSG